MILPLDTNLLDSVSNSSTGGNSNWKLNAGATNFTSISRDGNGAYSIQTSNDNTIYNDSNFDQAFASGGAICFSVYPHEDITVDDTMIWQNPNTGGQFDGHTSIGYNAVWPYKWRREDNPGGSGEKSITIPYNVELDAWNSLCLVYNNSYHKFWLKNNNGSEWSVTDTTQSSGAGFVGSHSDYLGNTYLYGSADAPGDVGVNVIVDGLVGFKIWPDEHLLESYHAGNWTIVDSNAPVFSSINCTSCNDAVSPYSSSNLSPSFYFETDVNANCRIASTNINYTAMGSSKNCYQGQGENTHTCILTDELDSVVDYVYAACQNSISSNENSTTFLMDIIAPQITAINCTSCNIPNGDVVAPYTTSDTTPTFTFNTDVGSYCRVSDSALNYSVLGDSRNCTGGQGGRSHTCSLTVQDELVSSTDNMYVICENGVVDNGYSTLQMDITNLQGNTSNAIEWGIQNSSIWPNVKIYTNQQIYLRNLQNQQVLATADKVAVYKNQRWILNVAIDSESKLGLFNLTPVVYVLDMANISITDIRSKVSSLITATVK